MDARFAGVVSSRLKWVAAVLLGTAFCYGTAMGQAVCGNFAQETGEQCDLGPNNGTATFCCESNCTLSATTKTCRPGVNSCDAAENCDGINPTCPGDGVAPTGTVCRASAGVCDVAETCNGTTTVCPADAFSSGTTVCRAAADVCDAQETCTGSSATCPGDSFQSTSVVCRPATGECDVAENCPGDGISCPQNLAAPQGTACTDDGRADTLDICNGEFLCIHTAALRQAPVLSFGALAIVGALLGGAGVYRIRRKRNGVSSK